MNLLFRTTQAWNTTRRRDRMPESSEAPSQRGSPEFTPPASAVSFPRQDGHELPTDYSPTAISAEATQAADWVEADWIVRARGGEVTAFE